MTTENKLTPKEVRDIILSFAKLQGTVRRIDIKNIVKNKVRLDDVKSCFEYLKRTGEIVLIKGWRKGYKLKDEQK